jgi:hypothetical protein
VRVGGAVVHPARDSIDFRCKADRRLLGIDLPAVPTPDSLVVHHHESTLLVEGEAADLESAAK